MAGELRSKIGLFGLTFYGVDMILGAEIYALIAIVSPREVDISTLNYYKNFNSRALE